MNLRTIFVITSRELGMYFRSPLVYGMAFFYSLLTGLTFFFSVYGLNGLSAEYSVTQFFFQIPFLWFAQLIIMPVLTMRVFSEEYRLGTFEGLMTAPVSEWDVVLGKYLACIVVYFALLSPTLLYVPVLRLIMADNTPLEKAPIWAVYWIYLLWGFFYGAIGVMASALTKSQVLALVISFCLSCVFFFIGFIIYFDPPAPVRLLGHYISAYEHLDLAVQGQLSTQSAVLYLSAAAFLLLVTQQIILARRERA